MKLYLFFFISIVLTCCKMIDDKVYGPLKPEAKQYIPLLTDTIVAHNPEVVKYIHFDTTALMLKVVYDASEGDVSEIGLTIEGLDLLAPIVNEDSLKQVSEEQQAQEKLEKQVQIVKEFVKKQVDQEEIKRLDSVHKQRIILDSLLHSKDSSAIDSLQKEIY